MIISHNTFTYRKCQWWLRPLAWMARCQSKDYKEQQVDGYDMRVFWTEDKGWEFRHGIFRYTADDMFDIFDYCNRNGKFLRIMLEDRNKWTSKKVEKYCMVEKFRRLCHVVQVYYPNIHLFGGRNVRTWEMLYDFGFNPATYSYFASNDGNKWWQKINDLWPWLYAKKHNEENLKKIEGIKGYHFFDFV